MTKRQIVFIGNSALLLSGQLLAGGLGLFYLSQEPTPFWTVAGLSVVVAGAIFSFLALTWYLVLSPAWWKITAHIQQKQGEQDDAESYGKEADKIPGPVEPPA